MPSRRITDDLRPVERWDPLPDLGDEPSVNVSGIACGPAIDGRRVCLVVYDEKRHAAFLTLENRRFGNRRRIRLLDKGVDPGDDADLEAVAYDGGVCWVFGSHSRKKTGQGAEATKLRPSRRHLYHFPVDAAGLPTFAFDEETRSAAVTVVSDLIERLALPAELSIRLFSATPLAEGGLNIEGGTTVAGRVLLGLRAASEPDPTVHDGALVFGFDAADLAGDGAIRTRISTLRLGPGLGIRDLIALGANAEAGFLVLAGAAVPDDGADNPAKRRSSIWFWPGEGEEPAPCGRLAEVPENGKPEALLVVGEDGETWSVLVLCDGVWGGAPTVYRVPKPR